MRREVWHTNPLVTNKAVKHRPEDDWCKIGQFIIYFAGGRQSGPLEAETLAPGGDFEWAEVTTRERASSLGAGFSQKIAVI